MQIELTKQELGRYARHISIPEFNVEGQKKLKAAKVLVIGSGGLGSPVLLYLAAAGIGTIGIVDFDVVDDSNLQRQVLFTVDDIGKSKAETAAKRLKALNPNVRFEVYNTQLTSENALDIIKDYDVIADGTDNFPTRYLVNDACVLADKVNVYASIFRFEGQVSVFNYVDKDGVRGPNYRDMFPEPPPPGLVPNCAEGGVLGVLPGIIGSMQALEVIKVITGVGEPLSGRIFLFDASIFSTRILKVKRKPETRITELIDYQQFCGIATNTEEEIKSIDVDTLYKWQQDKKPFMLIDVREQSEYDLSNMNGELIPLGSVLDNYKQFEQDMDVVIHCRSGKRSADAIQILENKHGFSNLYNLTGGILAWKNKYQEIFIE